MNSRERSLHLTSAWQSDWVLEAEDKAESTESTLPAPPEASGVTSIAPVSDESDGMHAPHSDKVAESSPCAEGGGLEQDLEAVDISENLREESPDGGSLDARGAEAAKAEEPAEAEEAVESTAAEAEVEKKSQQCESGQSRRSCFEVVRRGGVFLREQPSRDATSKGRLAFGQRVFGVLTGEWLRVERNSQEEVEGTTYVLVDGSEWGLGTLLQEMPTAESSPLPSTLPEDSQPTKLEPEQVPSPEPEQVPSAQSSSLTKKSAGPAQKARLSSLRRAAAAAEEVLSRPVDYLVLAETPVYGEPTSNAQPLAGKSLQAGSTIVGYPGNASWIRLARVQGGDEEWALTKSLGSSKSGKDAFLSPAWAQLQAEEVFSEALVVSWQGLTAPKAPYVAAYSIEWRLTPGEELPIGGTGDFKSSGYALSLQPRATAFRSMM